MSSNDERRDGSAALYAALAAVYDRWQTFDGTTPFSELALGKLEPILGRRRPAITSFVDLGCGTGELLLALRARHPDWRLAGVDASDAMLSVARAKPNAAAIDWRAGSLERADASVGGGRFDAAGAFYDTLNHLTDRAALAQTFAAVARLLTPGGVFVFDVTNPLGFRRWWTGNRLWQGDDWQVHLEMAFRPATTDQDDGLGLAEVTIVEKNITCRATLTERCFPDPVITSALAAAGLAVESAVTWSPFDIDAPGKTLFICSKSSSAP